MSRKRLLVPTLSVYITASRSQDSSHGVNGIPIKTTACQETGQPARRCLGVDAELPAETPSRQIENGIEAGLPFLIARAPHPRLLERRLHEPAIHTEPRAVRKRPGARPIRSSASRHSTEWRRPRRRRSRAPVATLTAPSETSASNPARSRRDLQLLSRAVAQRDQLQRPLPRPIGSVLSEERLDRLTGSARLPAEDRRQAPPPRPPRRPVRHPGRRPHAHRAALGGQRRHEPATGDGRRNALSGTHGCGRSQIDGETYASIGSAAAGAASAGFWFQSGLTAWMTSRRTLCSNSGLSRRNCLTFSRPWPRR